MIYYTKENDAFRDIDELKPTICKSCEADGDRTYGHCEECLKNQAFNKEYIETHTFNAGHYLGDYHEHGTHNTFKSTFYRMKDEKPFLYYGVELEKEFDEDEMRVKDYVGDYDEYETSDDCERMLKELDEKTNNIWCHEEDGSLENGVEDIMRPTSYAKIISPEFIGWLQAGCDVWKKYGAWENQSDGCGMHIHISKKFFDHGNSKRSENIDMYTDLDWLFQYFQPELELLGGRKYTNYCKSKMSDLKCRYNIGESSSCYNGSRVELNVKGKMKKAKGGYFMPDRYAAIAESGNTIEVRIFKSSLDVTDIIGRLEIVRNFAHAVRDGEIVGKTLNELLHTKDNVYLDKLIDNVRAKCFKEQKKIKEQLKIERANLRKEENESEKTAIKMRIDTLKKHMKEYDLNLDRVVKDEMEIK